MRHPVLAAGLSISLSLLGCSGDPETTAPPPDAPQPAATTTLTFIHVSAGREHSCGVTADDRAWCWGSNQRGQLGDGTTAEGRLIPTAVARGLRFLDVIAGGWHTCGITTDNRAYCWGLDDDGQVGSGGTAACGGGICTRPVAVTGSRRYRQISTGFSHTCAVTLADKAFCWGHGLNGEVGDGNALEINRSPVAVKSGLLFRQVTAGGAHSCGVTTSSAAYCWGRNGDGQLGDRTRTDRTTPVAVFGGHAIREMSAGFARTCGVTTADVAQCWGSNLFGQVGSGTDWPRHLKPTAVAGGLRFSHVSAGLAHGCGITTSGRAWCWGNNFAGVLGDGTFNDSSVPVAVTGTRTWLEVRPSADAAHNCGVTGAGRAFCWGYNLSGQLGNGTTEHQSSPVPIVAPPN